MDTSTGHGEQESTCRVRLHGMTPAPEVPVEGETHEHLRLWMRLALAQDEVEMPWNPMRSYSGVEILNPVGPDPHTGEDVRYVAYSGVLIDPRRRRAWPAAGFEDWLLALVVDGGQGQEVHERVGRLRWRRVQKRLARLHSTTPYVTPPGV